MVVAYHPEKGWLRSIAEGADSAGLVNLLELVKLELLQAQLLATAQRAAREQQQHIQEANGPIPPAGFRHRRPPIFPG